MKARFTIGILVIIVLALLTACKPVAYYLEQVYKVCGKVTVAGSDPPVGIGSVEVLVGNYQYSELTNYYGDYEMELPEGTWTINFCSKDSGAPTDRSRGSSCPVRLDGGQAHHAGTAGNRPEAANRLHITCSTLGGAGESRT